MEAVIAKRPDAQINGVAVFFPGVSSPVSGSSRNLSDEELEQVRYRWHLFLPRLGLSSEEREILIFLKDFCSCSDGRCRQQGSDGISAQFLADSLGRSRSQMANHWLRRLKRRGIIEHHGDPRTGVEVPIRIRDWNRAEIFSWLPATASEAATRKPLPKMKRARIDRSEGGALRARVSGRGTADIAAHADNGLLLPGGVTVALPCTVVAAEIDFGDARFVSEGRKSAQRVPACKTVRGVAKVTESASDSAQSVRGRETMQGRPQPSSASPLAERARADRIALYAFHDGQVGVALPPSSRRFLTESALEKLDALQNPRPGELHGASALDGVAFFRRRGLTAFACFEKPPVREAPSELERLLGASLQLLEKSPEYRALGERISATVAQHAKVNARLKSCESHAQQFPAGEAQALRAKRRELEQEIERLKEQRRSLETAAREKIVGAKPVSRGRAA